MIAPTPGREAGRRAERLAQLLAPTIEQTQAQLRPTGLRLDRVEISWTERRPIRLPRFFTTVDLWRSLFDWLVRILPVHETVTVTVSLDADGPDRTVVRTVVMPKRLQPADWNWAQNRLARSGLTSIIHD